MLRSDIRKANILMEVSECRELVDRLIETVGAARHRRADLAAVDVVVWPRGEVGEVLECLGRVFRSEVMTPFEAWVVDNGSGDRRRRECLDRLSAAGLVRLVSLGQGDPFLRILNEQAASGRDMVLLSSDAEVHGDWLDRLRRAAHADDEIATVSPFCNIELPLGYPSPDGRASIPSDTDAAALDRHCGRVNAGKAVEIPFFSLSCAYLKRSCWDALRLVMAPDMSGGARRGPWRSRECCRPGVASWRPTRS